MEIVIRKAGRSVDVDMTRLCIAVDGTAELNKRIADEFNATLGDCPALAYVVRYGLTQALNDAHASMTSDDGADSIMAVVEKKLDAIYNGTLRAHTGGGKPAVDPITRLAFAMARDEVKAGLKASGKALKGYTKEALTTAYQRHFDANAERFNGAAKDFIEKAKASASVNLDDLFTSMPNE